jgi:hypothetical protein
MTTQVDDADRKKGSGDPAAQGSSAPSDAKTPLDRQAVCDHDWQRDGQTLTAIRWTCTKCLKTELRP